MVLVRPDFVLSAQKDQRLFLDQKDLKTFFFPFGFRTDPREPSSLGFFKCSAYVVVLSIFLVQTCLVNKIYFCILKVSVSKEKYCI